MTDSDLKIAPDDRPLFRPRKPPVRWGFPLLLGALIAAAGMIYYFWQLRVEPQRPAPEPAATAPQITPQPSAEPRIEHPIEAAGTPAAAPLPVLAESDPSLQEALGSLFGSASFDLLFHPQDIVRHFVAAIDNLPRKTLAQRVMPIKPVTGAFRTTGPEGSTVVGPENAARYTPYVRALEAVDSAKLVALYVRFYPLFQQAYAELGYPSRYFNDRVFDVIDHLLATPDVRGPIALVQPKVMYEYADPALQDLSAGQKMLVRMGPENEAKVKAKLRELKKALTRGL
ncbi:MAG: DUF3014 domain-containing protein [Pseudomonadota bacterium]|nr:DUF3014 domain-containing protein [Pseudomonadota bacterium]